ERHPDAVAAHGRACRRGRRGRSRCARAAPGPAWCDGPTRRGPVDDSTGRSAAVLSRPFTSRTPVLPDAGRTGGASALPAGFTERRRNRITRAFPGDYAMRSAFGTTPG